MPDFVQFSVLWCMSGIMGEDNRAMMSIARKLKQVSIPFEGLQPTIDHVQEVINFHVQEQQRVAIKAWKAKVAMWHTSSAELYAFVRNPEPAKACMVSWGGKVCSSGSDLFAAMQDVWGEVESWPSVSRKLHAEEVLDEYLVRAPFVPTVMNVSPVDLWRRAPKAP